MSLTRRALRASLLLAPLAAHGGRLALSLVAIALGVALGYAVQLINKSATAEMARSMRSLSGTADLVVHGPRGGFSEHWYGNFSALPEVEEASPVVEVQARLYGRDEALRVLGIDIFRAGRIQPALGLSEGGEALDFLRPGRIFLSPSAAEWLGRRAGQPLQLQSGMDRIDLTVAGVLSAGSLRERVGVMDIAAAQDAFRRQGVVTRIDLKLRPGVDVDAFAARVGAGLPPGLLLERPSASVDRNASMSRAYRINL